MPEVDRVVAKGRLYAHAVGRWGEKVRGRTVYFTSWAEDSKGQAALEQWLQQKADLLAVIERINAEQHRIPWMGNRLPVLSVYPDRKPRGGPQKLIPYAIRL